MYAYSLCVFGDPEYLKGAAALAASIRQFGTGADILLLVTEDVRSNVIRPDLFTRIIPVPYLTSGPSRMSFKQKQVYAGFITQVVTKLAGIRIAADLGYSKVILLDVDMIFLRNCDILFQISCPGATWGVPNGITPELDNIGPWITRQQIDRQLTNKTFVCSGALLLVEASQREFERILEGKVDNNNPSGPEEQLFAQYCSKWYSGCTVIPNDYNVIPWKKYTHSVDPKIYHFHSSKPWATDRKAWPDLAVWWEVYDQL